MTLSRTNIPITKSKRHVNTRKVISTASTQGHAHFLRNKTGLRTGKESK